MIKKESFGKTKDGQAVDLYTFSNASGMEVRAMTYGGIILSIKVPDRNGKFDDVTLGFDSLEPYLANSTFFGALVGRYGNRIGKARFKLDGKEYKLAVNNGPNALHGGLKGFDKVIWQAESFDKPEGVGVVFRYTSPDGEEGYPGTLQVLVTYTLTDKNELALDYHATTDKATPVNLTNHAYFNLAGPGVRIDANDQQIKYGPGYDHNFVLNRKGEGLSLAARVVEPTTGRVMEVSTTEPAVQFYTGNFLDGTLTGKGGHVYKRRYAFCLETQHFPDSPNKPSFPSTIVKPGETYTSKTVYAFSVEK